MRKLRFWFALVLYCGISWSVAGQKVQEQLGEFQEVKLFNAVEAIVIPSQENRIEITGHSREEISYEIVDGVLEIKLSLDNIWSEDNTLVRIYGKSIEIIDANQGAMVRMESVLKGEAIVLRVQEGAKITGEVKAEKAEIKSVSGGVIKINGEASTQEVEVNTGGQYLGQDFRTQKTEVGVGTAGRAEVYVTKYCKAKATLGGIVQVFGNPEKVDTKTNLGGKVK